MSKNYRNGGKPPVSVSQNFLTGQAAIRRLLSRASIGRDDHVIEIGGGKGHITRELAKRCRRVDAYEIDGALYRRLITEFTGQKGVCIRHQDFLKAELPRSAPYKVFSNIPFSITSAIVRKLTACPNPPAEAWLVMEKGAAKRFIGRPSETSASLHIKPYFNAEIVYHLSRNDFHPVPSVDVVMLRLTKKEQPDLPPSERKAFESFIEWCMRHGIGRMLTKRQVSTALKHAGLPDIRTSREMLYVQWLCLFRCYRRFHTGG